MNLKLDENLSRHLKPVLAVLGDDVATVQDEGLLGRADTAVAKAAATGQRLLLTLDVEFADLRKYPPGRHPGIVLFRPRSFGPLAVNSMIERFVRETEFAPLSGCIAVVEPGRVRVRRPTRDNDDAE